MKTKDIIKLGIDRNLIRECERQGLIKPDRTDGIMIVDEKYHPREYSHADLEIIWGTYLLRKMGFSFSEIKKWWNGENIQIRNNINDSIEKFEHQIEELQVTIDFMKYVRGMGYFPDPPKKLNEVSNFKVFLTEYMKSIDPDGSKREYMEYVNRKLELEKIPQNKRTSEQMLELKKIKKYEDNSIEDFLRDKSNVDCANELRFLFETFEELVLLKERSVNFSSKETQGKIREIYNEFNKLIRTCNHSNIKPIEFHYMMYKFFSEDTDAKEVIIKEIGEENIAYFLAATFVFAKNEDPESYNAFFEKFKK